jgi:hypothetical protein
MVRELTLKRAEEEEETNSRCRCRAKMSSELMGLTVSMELACTQLKPRALLPASMELPIQGLEVPEMALPLIRTKLAP